MRGVEKETKQKVPKWENDFWSYINRGNGLHCPLFSFCMERQHGGWCPYEHSRYLVRLIQEGCHSPGDCCEFQNIVCGRMFSCIDKLAQKYLSMGRIVYPPVPADIISLADKNHHIEIRYLPLKNIHGALWYWNDEWIVQLNGNDSSENRKFTLLHESFHILTFCHTSLEYSKGNIEREYFNELLADQFAMCIIMPKKWVTKVWQDTNSTMKIAKIFDVPEHLVDIRLSYLHLL